MHSLCRKGFTVYRFLSFFWLILGSGLLFLPWLYPDLSSIPRMENHVALGALCFALSIYNMVRWRMGAARERARQEEMEEALRRRRSERPVDPTFDFTDRKPPDDRIQLPPT
jgi:hypothetical protein